MAVRIADIPENDRPRERLARVGLSGLSDAELIALVIRTGGRGRSALDVGRRILAEHGSLHEVGAARPEELSRDALMGWAKAAGLSAAFELGRRATARSRPGHRILGPVDVVGAVIPFIQNARKEEAFVLVTTASARVVRVERLTLGAANRALLPVRDVIATVLRHDGIGFALAHTHPSGDPDPSPEDVDATRQIGYAAEVTGLRFIDHVVVAGTRWASLRTLGHLADQQRPPH